MKKAATKAVKAKAEKRAVLVTTAHRGVFFGYLTGEPAKEKVTLENVRNCVYWDASVHGFVGLAATGPSGQCKVGPAAPEVTLYDITSVLACTQDAVAKWEAAPWR
jgi:hypothetical protein